MKTLQKRCERVLKELVKKSFPELKNKKIILKIKKLKVGSMWASKRPFHFVLIIDPIKYRDATDSQLRGVIAHELVHFENYSPVIIGWIRFCVENLAFYLSRNWMAFYERKTDREVIKLGYAKDLSANRVFRKKNSTKKYWDLLSSCYLMPEEIKNYAKSINKW